MNTDRFKFRAWDKVRKQIVYPDVIHHNINLGCTIYRAFKPSYGEGYFPIQENLTLMQCTGLKDIEGNLIYEGDLIDCGGFHRDIRWENGRFIAVHLDEDYVDCLEYNMKTIKVIGNKYELQG